MSASTVGRTAGPTPNPAATLSALREQAPDLVERFLAELPGARAATLARLWGALAREPIPGVRARARLGEQFRVDLDDGRSVCGPAGAAQPFAAPPPGLRLQLQDRPGIAFDDPARLLAELGLPGQAARLGEELDNSVANLALARAVQPAPDGGPPALARLAAPHGGDPLATVEQYVVDGHPLHPCCRTRAGLATADVLAYAPEHRPVVALELVEVPAERWLSTGTGLPPLLPMHPWQRDHLLDAYPWLRPTGRRVAARPLMSLRTLAVVRDRWQHLKTAVSAQMTSAVRTVSPAAVHNGPVLSQLLADLAGRVGGLSVMAEPAGGAVLVDGAAERALSVLVRQVPRVGHGEVAVPLAALAAPSPADRRPLVCEAVRLGYAGDPVAFFAAFAEVVLPPLLAALHLGVALEAHGQNLLVVLRSGRPVRLLYRDLGGVRVSATRLARAGLPAPPLRGELPCEDPQQLRAKLWAAVGVALGEQVAVLARASGVDPAELWAGVGRAARDTYRELPAEARGDATVLDGDTWPVKATTAMRLADDPLTDVWTGVPNPLGGRQVSAGHRLADRLDAPAEAAARDLERLAPGLVAGFRAALPAASATVSRRLLSALHREGLTGGDRPPGTEHGFDRVEFAQDPGVHPVALLPAGLCGDGTGLAAELGNAVVNLALAYARRAARPDPTPGGDPDEVALAYERLAVDGHNLHPCGRTRLGWGVADALAHDLETGGTAVEWVAVRRDLLVGDDLPAACADAPRPPPGYALQPVHAWQLATVLRTRHADLLRDGAVRPTGHRVPAAPTAALRTLLVSGVDGRRRYLKVSLDIQVTSTRRGISVASARNGPAISATLGRVLADDPAGARVLLLPESAGAAVAAGDGRDATAILRGGLDGRLGPDEVAIPGGALGALDPATGRSVIAGLATRYAQRYGLADSGGTALGFVEAYARLLLPPVLRLATRYGIGLEAHLQNCLPTFVAGVPHRLVLRDFAGLRLHLPRLGAAGLGLRLWPGSVIGTEDLGVLRAKIGYTALQAHLGEIVVQLVRSHGLDEPAAWRRVGAVLDEVYEGLRADPGHAGAAAADHAALTAPIVPHKALVRMRLTGQGDVYVPVHNALHEP